MYSWSSGYVITTTLGLFGARTNPSSPSELASRRYYLVVIVGWTYCQPKRPLIHRWPLVTS